MMPDPLEALRLPVVPVEPRPEFAAACCGASRASAEPTGPQRATVRYFVDDLDAAVAFYCGCWASRRNCAPRRPSPCSTAAICACCSASPGGATPCPTAALPAPGGWNRISLRVPDLPATVEELRSQGARFRTGIITGVGVRQSCSTTRPATSSSCSSRPPDTTSEPAGRLTSRRPSPDTKGAPDEHRQRPVHRQRRRRRDRVLPGPPGLRGSMLPTRRSPCSPRRPAAAAQPSPGDHRRRRPHARRDYPGPGGWNRIGSR